jgi:shikimate dehydrogenase
MRLSPPSGASDERSLTVAGPGSAPPADRARRLSAATAVVGVMGDPISHSLSPLLHNTAFDALGLDWVSVGFPVPSGRAQVALAGARSLGVRGLSVTMPHKEDVARLVDRRSESAERLGAVNCVIFQAETTVGENTDGPGLVGALKRGDRFDPAGHRCLVLGAGGAARAVIDALAVAGATEVIVVNRTAERAAAAAALAGAVGRVGEPGDAPGCDLIVNATPVGMVGARQAGTAALPLDPGLLGPHQVVVDLIYHPAETAWLAAARQRGATTANGLGMLVHQAALQLAAWTGLEPPVEAMWAATRSTGAADPAS